MTDRSIPIFLFCTGQKSFVKHSLSVPVWPTFGKNFSRNSYIDEFPSPPLKLKWKRKLDSGASESFAANNSYIIIPTRNGKIHFINNESGKTEKTIKIKKRSRNTGLAKPLRSRTSYHRNHDFTIYVCVN